MLHDNCYDNLFSQFRPLKDGKGREVFQIEANFGLTLDSIKVNTAPTHTPRPVRRLPVQSGH